MVIKKISSLEIHTEEGNRQESLFFKLVIARAVNTAVLISIVQHEKANWDHMLTERETRKIQDILLADCFQTPLFRVLFALVSVELYDKRIRGGRAKTQEELNHLYLCNACLRCLGIVNGNFGNMFVEILRPFCSAG